MTIRSPKYNSQGYTLVEMIAVLLLIGVIAAIASPALLSFNKPLKDSTSQFRSQLNLLRSKAISSNQAYRIRPKYPAKAQYPGEKYANVPHTFIVEYAANCQIGTYGPAAPAVGVPDGWRQATQFELDLPESVGIDGTTTVAGNTTTGGSVSFPRADGSGSSSSTYEANLNWNICYDNRGLVDKPVTFTFKDFQGNNRAQTSTIDVQKISGVAIINKDKTGTIIAPDPVSGPVF